MRVMNLELKNFRNHKKLGIDFQGESFLIEGPNGCGKSNILEALHLLSTTKSMKAQYDKEMINYENDTANVNANIVRNEDPINLQLAIQKNPNFENMSKKLAKVDKTTKSLSVFSGQLNTVLFTPESIELVIGAPSLRRKYLDTVFFQIDRDYKNAHTAYTKTLRQRNKLLEKIRDEGIGLKQLDFWDEQLLTHGTLIQLRRQDFLNFLNDNIHKYAAKLTEQKNTYEAKYIKKEITPEKFREYQIREIAAKSTLMGPHRDDIEFIFNTHDLAGFGSRGQQRVLVLILKLCELDYIEKKVGMRPVLLLDDIYSELDKEHRTAIENIIPLQQTIITTVGSGQEGLRFSKIQ